LEEHFFNFNSNFMLRYLRAILNRAKKGWI